MIDERKIIIGLITSTEYCQKIKDIWNSQFIESATAKRLAGWVWEYYDKYHKAPGREIESIYFSKLKDNKLPKDIAEEIEQDILPDLSKEYENEEFNLTYYIEETEKHFSSQHLKLHTENIQTLLSSGEIEKAEGLANSFKPLSTVTNRLDEFVLSVNQIRRQNRPSPPMLLKPWLKEGQLTLIYGTFGTGKSLLVESIAYLIGLRQFEEYQIGKWQVKKPTGCLYIDGELGQLEMEERMGQFEWMGKQSQEHRIKILSMPEFQLETADTFYLSERVNQKKILRWLIDHPTYKLLILDSISTLFGLVEENDNSEWSTKVNPFLRDLRAAGIACILLHHAGKEAKRGLRGASSMGAMAHNIFRLTDHPTKSEDKGEAWFILTKDKQRAGGFNFKTFALKYTQNINKTETHWETTELY